MPRIVVKTFLRSSTPIEEYDGVYVKRDDLCCDSPALAKIRGVYRYVEKRPSFDAYGALDGRHSRNGWALARVCRHFGKRAYVFWPILKSESTKPTTEVEGESRAAARSLGAGSLPIQAGRSAVVYAEAKRQLSVIEPNSIMLPNALKIEETVDAHVEEIRIQRSDLQKLELETLVLTCGTGTIEAGVLAGLFRIGIVPEVKMVLGYSQDEKRLRQYLKRFTAYPQEKIQIVDQGFNYGERRAEGTPFPANQYYEAIAWKWMQDNRDKLLEPILFWSSGD